MVGLDGGRALAPGLFDGTSLERPVTCEQCAKVLAECSCPRDEGGAIVPPKHQPARVSRERRGGGKMVTVVTGLDPKASDLPAMLKEFKSSLGTGGTIDGARIEIQGDHRDKIVESLRQMGYPAKTSGG
jgi:translation initiation factor 1